MQWESNQEIEKEFRQFSSVDEFEAEFDQLFPDNKDNMKILVFESDNKLELVAHLYIFQDENNKKIGHMHDLLLSRESALKDDAVDAEAIKRLMFALECIAHVNECDQLRVADDFIDNNDIYRDLDLAKVNINDTFWQK